MTLRRSVLAATVFLAASTLAARADVLSYTSVGAFNAASTTTSFSFPAPAGTFEKVSNPFTSGLLTFTANNVTNSSGGLFNENDGAYGPGKTYLDNFTGSDLTAAKETVSVAGVGATALAFDIGVFNGAETLTFDINGNLFSFKTPAAQTPIFVGFTSSSPITSLTIQNAAYSEIDILDYRVGAATTGVSPVPEPSSLALLGTGALALVGAARRRLSRS